MIFNGETFRNDLRSQTSQKEINCHIFKVAILTKFFGDLMNHITREYAGEKNKIIYECFIIKNHGYTFVCFFGIQSLL